MHSTGLAIAETKTPSFATGLAVRQACRDGGFDRPTPGLAPGFVQANLAILPRDWAHDFLRFCQRNPKPCPLIGVSETGDPGIRPSVPSSTSAPICRATGSGATASSSKSRPTSRALAR